MAMRRPRIKPVANILLNSKRKAKLTTNDVKSNIVGESDVNSVQEAEKIINDVSTQESKCVGGIENTVQAIAENSVDTTANRNNLNKNNACGGKERNGIGSDVKELQNKARCIIKTKTENEENVAIEKDLNYKIETPSKNSYVGVIETLNDSKAFKCPPEVGFQRTISHTSNSGIDDVFYSDIEENALQMDSEKSVTNVCPMSPSKNLARQRIRPTPHFGQRRNSFVCSSPSPHTSANEDNHPESNVNNDLVQTRRERHHSASFTANSHSSASLHHHPHTAHKYLPAGITNSGMGRIRTESGCSVFSDTNTSTQKLRKTEDHKHRKDFEARFHNRVPEKNALKMYDLIYYNPATNPMEKKPNPSEKLEKVETSPIDAKPFAEEVQKDTDNEAVPVPQLKLNAKGELILDDKSLVIETTAEQEARKVLANSSLIYLDECTGMNGFYTRRKGTRKWSPSDTIKFYRCLQNVGTDFSLMVALFPNRTRRDIKLKFKKEERKNSHLINKAIVHPKLFDIESLKQELDEEEKRLEQTVAVKKKSKKSIKQNNNAKSKACRVLRKTEGVYENESIVNPKVVSTTGINSDKSDAIVQNEKETTATRNDSIETEISEEITHNKNERKRKNKRKRKREYFIKQFKRENEFRRLNSIYDDNWNWNFHITRDDSVYQQLRRHSPKKAQKAIIKEEIIKIENKQESTQTSDSTEYQDTKQLQTEIDELLGSDAADIQYDNTSYDTSAANLFADTSEVEQYKEQTNSVLHKAHEEDCTEYDTDIDKYEHTSFVNLDDGSVEVYSNIKDDIVFITSPTIASPSHPNRSQYPHSASQSPIGVFEIDNANENNSLNSTTPELDINNDTCSSVISERELSEGDIQSILRELAEGSLVLVSTLDPDDPDKVLNEIYMVDKNTGDLCDEPLSIPDNIVQCILTVVS